MAKESVEFMKDTLDSNWNRGNTDQRKPVVMDITTLDPGRGKRFDLNRSDAVFLYETAHSEEQPEVFYDFVHTPYQRHRGHTHGEGQNATNEDGRRGSAYRPSKEERRR